jgi:peptide/nickel transport system ATP-binding protein
MAFQSAQNQLNPIHKILDQIAEPMITHGFKTRSEARKRSTELLRQIGLSEIKSSFYPHQLSGGEQQRVLIAIALANDSETLILDEPVSSLDVDSRKEMMAFLQKAITGRTVLLTTHDLATAAQMSTKVATLYGGRIVELGPTTDVFLKPRHPYTRALLRSCPTMSTVKDLQGIKGRMDRRVSGCPFNQRCTQEIQICREMIPSPRKYGERLLACHRGGIIAALSVTGMSKSYGRLKVLDHVSLTLHHGETLALVGRSGSGKTTLARLITGMVDPDEGEIFLEEVKVDRRSSEFHRSVQMVFQNPGEALSHRLTVMEAVREPLEIQGFGKRKEQDDMVFRVIEEVELPTTRDFMDEYPHHLSGGELQRVNIARALVLDPKVLIADEATAFLDPSIQSKILKLLLNLQENRGLSMLFITHDIAVARKISDRIAVMQEGRIVEQGPASLMVTSPSHTYTQSLLKAASDLPFGNR